MKYANLLVSCACLLLLRLEMGAGSAAVSRPSQSLYTLAQGMGLDAAGLDEIWRTRRPLTVTKQGEAGEQTRITYELSPDLRTLSMNRLVQRVSPVRIEAGAPAPSKPQEDWEYVGNAVRRPASVFPEPNFGSDNTFTNSFGTGFPFSSPFPNWGLPEGVTPRTETKTEVDNQGRRITTTTSTYSGPISPGHSPFGSLFPDISRAPGPIYPENTPKPQNPSVRPVPSQPGGPFFGQPAFPTPLNPPSPKEPTEPTWVPVQEATSTQRPLNLLPRIGGAETDSPIDKFLGLVNISASEIEANNGELVKTIVDKRGRVLTARFVLSSVKGDSEQPKQPAPTK